MRVIILKKDIIFSVCGYILLGIAVCVLSLRGIYTSAMTYGRDCPIYSVETAEKKICVTFDAAWGGDDTDSLLAVLQKHNAKATVFAVAEWAEANPACIVKFKNAGHEIANHSYDHTLYTTMSRNEILDDVAACNESLAALTGTSPVLVRVPSGEYDRRVIRTIYTVGLYPIQWDVDSLDYTGLSVQQITERVLPKVRCGSILLFHTGVKNTPAALEEILTALERQEYRFVTVGSLILKDRFTTDSEGRQIPMASATFQRNASMPVTAVSTDFAFLPLKIFSSPPSDSGLI